MMTSRRVDPDGGAVVLSVLGGVGTVVTALNVLMRGGPQGNPAKALSKVLDMRDEMQLLRAELEMFRSQLDDALMGQEHPEFRIGVALLLPPGRVVRYQRLVVRLLDRSKRLHVLSIELGSMSHATPAPDLVQPIGPALALADNLDAIRTAAGILLTEAVNLLISASEQVGRQLGDAVHQLEGFGAGL